MSFGIPEIHAEKEPKHYGLHGRARAVRSQYTPEQMIVILTDGREVGGEFNNSSSTPRFHFEVDGHWYNGPMFGNAWSSPSQRGLITGDRMGKPVADLRLFVKGQPVRSD